MVMVGLEPLNTSWPYSYMKDIQADQKTHRTLFVSQAGLEHAKQLVSSYKRGEANSMTPDLWQAKKIVDSTIHPGEAQKMATIGTEIDHCDYRYGRASLPTFPHVMLCDLEPRCYSGYAYTRTSGESSISRKSTVHSS